jgi:crooked neck
VQQDARDYEAWFDYCALEEQVADNVIRTRAVYERAVACAPLQKEKKAWKRYIYLWINWAVFEEVTAKDEARAKDVYQKAVKLVPHSIFSFSKLWTLYAHFLIRQRDLVAARKVFGMALGMCPRPKLFKAYAELELQLGEVDRCRKIYERQVELFPADSEAWIAYAEFEGALCEYERAKQIYELAAVGSNGVSVPLD